MIDFFHFIFDLGFEELISQSDNLILNNFPNLLQCIGLAENEGCEP